MITHRRGRERSHGNGIGDLDAICARENEQTVSLEGGLSCYLDKLLRE